MQARPGLVKQIHQRGDAMKIEPNRESETLKDIMAAAMRQIDQIIGHSYQSIVLEEGRHPETHEVAFKMTATCRACKRVVEVTRRVGDDGAGAELVKLFIERTGSHARLHSIILVGH
jgi:hypothetical protein